MIYCLGVILLIVSGFSFYAALSCRNTESVINAWVGGIVFGVLGLMFIVGEFIGAMK